MQFVPAAPESGVLIPNCAHRILLLPRCNASRSPGAFEQWRLPHGVTSATIDDTAIVLALAEHFGQQVSQKNSCRFWLCV